MNEENVMQGQKALDELAIILGARSPEDLGVKRN